MDSASNARLRAIVDRLLASTLITPSDRLLVAEAKAILEPRPPGTITITHAPRTVPEPAIITARMPEVGR